MRPVLKRFLVCCKELFTAPSNFEKIKKKEF
jgi:hypothetical protein